MTYQTIPTLRRGPVRFDVLLYLCTDPPNTWTRQGILDEFVDMGHPRSTVGYALQGLTNRGLISSNREKGQTHLAPTLDGMRAIKPHIQAMTAKA